MSTVWSWTRRVGLFLAIAVVFWFVWNEAVSRMFASGSTFLGHVAFWFGRWTFTGWLFYLLVVYVIYRVVRIRLWGRTSPRPQNTGENK